MDKCPFCGAETRQGDNFCLNCGNRLLPATPSVSPQQAQPVVGEATLAAPENWAASVPESSPQPNWSEASAPTIADTSIEQPSSAPTVQATMERIEQPARMILHTETGEIVQEYPLDKGSITIGRAPSSDILLSKDKLTSRRHATVLYVNSRYILRDEGSANGTFVNGEQIEDGQPYELRDGDLVGIGEHELVFRAYGSTGTGVEDLPTIAEPFKAPVNEITYRTQEDDLATIATNDDFGTHSMDENSENNMQASSLPTVTSNSEAPVNGTGFSAGSAPEVIPDTPATVIEERPPTESVDGVALQAPEGESDMSFNRYSSFQQPALPDMSALMAALSTLDGQVMALQEQLNATQEAMRQHDADIAQTTNQLRQGVRRVSDRMDNTIADVARSREALAWVELLQLMEDVMNNPRDIEYVTKLARKARELNKVFQIHQNVLNTMAECNSLLRGMIGEDK